MIKELFEKQKVLMIAGAISLACFVILAFIAPFDSVQVLGINRWVKPMKFFVSTAIFVWTVAVFLYYLKDYKKSRQHSIFPALPEKLQFLHLFSCDLTCSEM